MGAERLSALTASVASSDPGPVVDFGCGRGTFLRLAALGNLLLTGVGVDVKADAVADATQAAIDAGVGDQLTFVCEDASTWSGGVGTAVCTGSSHALGGPAQMFKRLHDLGAQRVIIGDGFWATDPDEWCLENLGDMPRGIDALTKLATEAGWVVDEASAASLDEWDAFEGAWGDGVRSLGTEAARTFANLRAAEYQRYRGVLGFGWLQLSRPA